MSVAKLFFMCGKMGAGKSTAAQALAEELQAVLISEDEWLNALYSGKIKDFEDYTQYSRQLKPLLVQHLANVLKAGADVVMDFPANTFDQRAWFLQLANEAGAEHEMLYVQVSDEVCLERLGKRRIEQPERAAFDTPEVFSLLSSLFEEPSIAEQLNIRTLG